MIPLLLLILLVSSSTQAAKERLRRRSLLDAPAECVENAFVRIDVSIHNVSCTDKNDLSKMRQAILDHLIIPHATFDTTLHVDSEESHMCSNFLSEDACNVTAQGGENSIVTWRGGGECLLPADQACQGRRRELVQATSLLETLVSKKAVKIKSWSDDMRLEHLTSEQMKTISELERKQDEVKETYERKEDAVKDKIDYLKEIEKTNEEKLDDEEDAIKDTLKAEEEAMKDRQKIEKEVAKRIGKDEENRVKALHKIEKDAFEEKEDALLEPIELKKKKLGDNLKIDIDMLKKQEDLIKNTEKAKEDMLEAREKKLFKQWEGELFLKLAAEKRIAERELIIEHDVQKALLDNNRFSKCFDPEPTIVVELLASTSLGEAMNYVNSCGDR